MTEPESVVCECGDQVLVTLWHGRDMPVDPDPAPDGDIELCGLGVLRKPIAVTYLGTDSKWRYRPHWRCCPIQIALRPIRELTA